MRELRFTPRLGMDHIRYPVAAAIQMNQRIVDAVLSVASFTNGPILGVFLLSALAKRVRQTDALAGVVAGVIFMFVVWMKLNVSWQWYVLIGSSVTSAVAYASSFRRG